MAKKNDSKKNSIEIWALKKQQVMSNFYVFLKYGFPFFLANNVQIGSDACHKDIFR